MLLQVSGTGKVCRRRGEYQVFPSKFFCLTVPKISVVESFTVALVLGIEKVWITGGGGEYQDFLSKSFCLTVPKNSVGETFIVALISDTGKVCRRRGEYQDFPSKTFCLTVPKFSVGESFTVAVFSGTGKVWIRGGGGGSIKISNRKVFVSQCRKSL